MAEERLAWAWATAFLLWAALMALVLAPPAGAQTTREGILRATISENFERGESTTTYSVRSDGKTTPVLPTSPVPATTGDRVSVSGEMHEGTLVGSVEQEQDLTPEAELNEPRKVAVLLMRFPGDPLEPWPLAKTREEVFTGTKSANAFFQEETQGKIALAGKLNPEGDVFGWFTVNASTSTCQEQTWNAAAKAAAEQQGISFAGYQHVIYVSTFQLSCSWLGRATVSGSVSNVNGAQGATGVHVISHELGHNLGLWHAGSWTCTQGGVRVAISDSCSIAEYGDAFDVMGNISTRHSNAWNLNKLGQIKLSEHIETITAEGSYTIRSALSSEPNVLRVKRDDNPGGPVSWYYLEIRQLWGLFENLLDPSMTGVSIRATASGSAAETLLIDTVPATTTFGDAPLQEGRTFADGNVHITVLSAGAGTASVSVGFGAFVDSDAPSAPANISASQSSEGVKLKWSASTDNIGVTRYVVSRDGSEIGTSATTAFTDTGATVGLHAYTVHAEDEAGNRSDASAPKVLTVLDWVAPSAPTNVSASQGPGGVTLQWSASADNIGVTRYVVRRNGSEIGAGATTAFTDASPSVGPNAYTVYAEDEAGNRSPASATTVVMVAGPGKPPTPEDDSPSEEDSSDEKDATPRVKPLLRWQRRPSGALALEVDATRNPGVARVSLWLDGKLLRSKRGRVLRLIWTPPAMRCAGVYRFSARAYEPTADGKTVATARNRSVRLPGAC